MPKKQLLKSTGIIIFIQSSFIMFCISNQYSYLFTQIKYNHKSLNIFYNIYTIQCKYTYFVTILTYKFKKKYCAYAF